MRELRCNTKRGTVSAQERDNDQERGLRGMQGNERFKTLDCMKNKEAFIYE